MWVPGSPSLLTRRDNTARQMPAIDEQDPFRLERVAQGLHSNRKNRFAGLEARDRALADTRRSGEILASPIERRPRHPALNDIQFGRLPAKIACTPDDKMAGGLP